MDGMSYKEMVSDFENLISEYELYDYKIFLFGFCNASLELADLIIENGFSITAILDNSEAKQGEVYKSVPTCYPAEIFSYIGEEDISHTIVLISSRYYSAMRKQLNELGYNGEIRKIIDYNTYADYSLSLDTIARMKKREEHGERLVRELEVKYPNHFKTYFPFFALGDVYIAMSYWSAFAYSREIEEVVFCVPSKVLSDIIHMFGNYKVEIFDQRELDAMIQASLYTFDKKAFIAHQDRPYVINLSKALYVKKISLEKMYCSGVYGLDKNTKPEIPQYSNYIYSDIDNIPPNRSIILSPHAKSVIAIHEKIWKSAVNYYSSLGYKCFTNVVGNEKPIEGTQAISPSVLEMKSVVERAGIFIGIRSGLCDVIREAKAKKIALYPDYCYCDTNWKAIEIYWIDKFDYNVVATEDIQWENF